MIIHIQYLKKIFNCQDIVKIKKMNYFLMKFVYMAVILMTFADCHRKQMSFADMKRESIDTDSFKPINDIYKDCGKLLYAL